MWRKESSYNGRLRWHKSNLITARWLALAHKCKRHWKEWLTDCRALYQRASFAYAAPNWHSLLRRDRLLTSVSSATLPHSFTTYMHSVRARRSSGHFALDCPLLFAVKLITTQPNLLPVLSQRHCSTASWSFSSGASLVSLPYLHQTKSFFITILNTLKFNSMLFFLSIDKVLSSHFWSKRLNSWGDPNSSAGASHYSSKRVFTGLNIISPSGQVRDLCLSAFLWVVHAMD